MTTDISEQLLTFSATAAPGTVALLVCALILDWILGDPPRLYKIVPHPIVLIGRMIGFLDRKLNRKDRPKADRHVRGGITVILVVGAAAAIGAAITAIAREIPHGWLLEALVAGIFLAARNLSDEVGNVAHALEKQGLAAGRTAVGRIVGRDPKNLDQHGVARAAVESLSENFADGVIAPAFWFLLFGLPGLLAYKAINTLDSMIGYKSKKYRRFGYVAAKLDDVANWIPARLTAILSVIAAILLPSADPVEAIKTVRRDAAKHKSPNAGWPEAAFAGALNIALGGPRHYPGVGQVGVWIGAGRARLTPKDIKRARRLYFLANGIFVLGLILTWIIA